MAPVLALAIVLSSAGWDPAKAGKRLDERASMWQGHERTRRSHDTHCISCHSGAPYLIARPALRKLTGESELASAEKELLSDVADRVTKWSEVEPWYAHTEAKVRESRATEAIVNAFVLSYREPGSASALLKKALDNLWSHQRDDGGFDWLHFDLAPWETDESDVFGSCLAMVAAAGSSPGPEEPIARLAAYLRTQAAASENLHTRLGLLWAEASRPGLLRPGERKALFEEVLGAQTDDGGFRLSDLGPWKRKSDREDAYATGLAVHVLQRLSDPAAAEAVSRGLSWLESHQDERGGWFAESANKDRSADDPFLAGFMSDAAAAFAVLALSSR